jgi:hypothetical protein
MLASSVGWLFLVRFQELVSKGVNQYRNSFGYGVKNLCGLWSQNFVSSRTFPFRTTKDLVGNNFEKQIDARNTKRKM